MSILTKTIFSAIMIFFMMQNAFSETISYEREYTYKASEADSKLSARAISLEQLKVILLEEIGVSIKSKLSIRESSDSKAFGQRSITAVTAGLAKTTIIDEKWDGASYYIKARLSVDPENVIESIKTLQSEENDIDSVNQRSDSVSTALKENESIREKLKSNISDDDKARLYIEYKNNIDTIIKNNELLTSYIACTYPDMPGTSAPGWVCGEQIEESNHPNHPQIIAVGFSPRYSNIQQMKRTAAEDAMNNLKIKISNYMKNLVYDYYKDKSLSVNQLEIDDSIDSFSMINKLQGTRVYKTRTSPNGSLYVLLGVPRGSLEFYTRRLIQSLQ